MPARRRPKRPFRTEKGITPIIAIVILLFIVIAIGGAVYTFLGGVITATTGGAALLTGTSCGPYVSGSSGPRQAVFYFKNVGSGPIAVQGGAAVFPPPAAPTLAQYSLDGGGADDAGLLLLTTQGVKFVSDPFAPGAGMAAELSGSGILASAPTAELQPAAQGSTAPGEGLTLEAQVKINLAAAPDGTYPVIRKGDAVPDYALLLVKQGSAAGLDAVFAGVATHRLLFAPFDGSAWHAVGASYDRDSGAVTVFLDGSAASKASLPGGFIDYAGFPTPLSVGNAPGAVLPAAWRVDEVRISAKAVPFSSGAQCASSGAEASCGNLAVSKTQGSPPEVSISVPQATVPQGGTLTIQDLAGCSGTCAYTVVVNGRPAPVAVAC